MARATLPLLNGITVDVEGPLGKRLVARHDDLSWEASKARWNARHPRTCVNVREFGYCTDRHCLVCTAS